MAELPVEKRRLELASEAVSALAYAAKGIRRADLVGRLGQLLASANAAAHLVAELEASGLLVRSADNTHDALLARKQEWEEHGWGSAFYYYAWIRDYPFLDYSTEAAAATDARMMAEYAKEEAPPPIQRDRGDAPVVALPPREHEPPCGSLHDAFSGRGSVSPFDAAALGALLRLSFGQTGELKRHSFPPLMLRTSPSGGARHPIDPYVVVFDVKGVEPGVYDYAGREHQLVVRQSGDARQRAVSAAYSLPQSLHEEVGALVFFTSVWARAAWRYRDPRAFRPVLHDLGHLVQTFGLVATGLGLGVHMHHGLDEAAAERLLGLQSLEQSVLYYGALWQRSANG